MILRDVAPYNSYKYYDGSTAAEQYEAWSRFMKEYLRERVKKGLLVEVASNYGKYTTQGWYNFYDFSEDPELPYIVGFRERPTSAEIAPIGRGLPELGHLSGDPVPANS